MSLNEDYERILIDGGADFVHFVDITGLPAEATGGYRCAVLFGKAISRDFLRAVHDGVPPKTHEILNTERKMDTLALKIAERLETDGFRSVGKLKTGVLPHKTVALRAGIGFVGKNNLLVTREYGCAQLLGKVLTDAPFKASAAEPKMPECGDCNSCVAACPTGALLGTTWSLTTSREEILTRKLCTLCGRCMVMCPYTIKYLG